MNFILDSKDLFCWYKQKKWFLWTMAAAKAAENHGDEWGLTWHLQWGIYTSIPTLTHSQNSLAAAEALSLKISSHEHLSNDYKDHSNQHENSHKLCNETGHPVLSLMESRWKMINVSQWRESHCRTNTSIRAVNKHQSQTMTNRNKCLIDLKLFQSDIVSERKMKT